MRDHFDLKKVKSIWVQLTCGNLLRNFVLPTILLPIPRNVNLRSGHHDHEMSLPRSAGKQAKEWISVSRSPAQL